MKELNSKFFYKNLLVLALPLILIVIVLGSFSILITERYVRDEIYKNSREILKQNSNDLSILFNDINKIYLTFGTNKDVTLYLERILNTNKYSLDDMWHLSMIESLFDSTSFSEPYIQSIYLYFNNPNKKFLVTGNGINSVTNYIDNKWYDSFLNVPKDEISWIEVRNLKMYNFDKKGIKVLSIYKKIANFNGDKIDGVLVLNIYLDYIENLLNTSTIFPDQKILILDAHDNLICQNINGNFTGKIDLDNYNKANIITKLESLNYNIKYVSIVPKKYLYEVPIKLLKVTLVLLLASIFFVILITFRITKRNYENVNKILKIIDAEKTNEIFPEIPVESRDEYSYIIYNIINSYIEKSQLKMELAEKKYKMKAMELLALQSQISPHFLSNALEIIYLRALSYTNGPNDVTKMIENLSQILKYLLSNPNETVTVKEEIENTKAYIQIMKVRYRDKFKVNLIYDDSILSCYMMKLMLQHLIENSIKHGLKKKNYEGSIKIKIKAVDKKKIKISVIDNGVGMSKERLNYVKRILDSDFDFYEHIGLMNTNERLKLLYGKDCEILIRSKLNIGTAVYIIFPYQYKNQNNDDYNK
ncbi:histidine kinase [Thermoanaerobacterium thermosaccharolyticum]|uniref:Histidine kinase n=1 Tax=Thermoanaerobacterium thermosaccharolyticum TaxID=1517 RepID=A0A231VKF2_THETR|nr:histidine kinase [Thermoanaerobacterium thermosaccharolyticum]OXT08441.1 histidine kinase [Thermoanaerobacterium thermosaccharolyticum]